MACFPDPAQGPYSPERNVEIFRALLCLLEGGRKEHPQFRSDPSSMRYYFLRQSRQYRICLFVACVMYLSISLTEVPDFSNRKDQSAREETRRVGKQWFELLLDLLCVIVFLVDLVVHCRSVGIKQAFSYRWTQIFMMLLVFDMMGIVWPLGRVMMVTGIVRCYPIVYYSKKARHATINYFRILPSVLLWIAVEFFFIFLFACFGVVLYANVDREGISGQEAFTSFSQAFISLYSLSLTVNDPDIYLPYYRLNFGNVFLFVTFLIVTFFLLHNIILSRVFQIYSEKMKESAITRHAHRQRAFLQAFQALDSTDTGLLKCSLVAYILSRLRPHYSATKIQTQMEYVHKVGMVSRVSTHPPTTTPSTHLFIPNQNRITQSTRKRAITWMIFAC